MIKSSGRGETIIRKSVWLGQVNHHGSLMLGLYDRGDNNVHHDGLGKRAMESGYHTYHFVSINIE